MSRMSRRNQRAERYFGNAGVLRVVCNPCRNLSRRRSRPSRRHGRHDIHDRHDRHDIYRSSRPLRHSPAVIRSRVKCLTPTRTPPCCYNDLNRRSMIRAKLHHPWSPRISTSLLRSNPHPTRSRRSRRRTMIRGQSRSRQSASTERRVHSGRRNGRCRTCRSGTVRWPFAMRLRLLGSCAPAAARFQFAQA